MTDLRQLHFRFRTDAGTADASPTWGAGEDVNYYPGTANFRLRIGLRNASTVVAATPWELYVSRNGDAYTPVTTTIAKGVQSVDAGSSADDTAVLVPRLYPFSQEWVLAGAAIDLDFANSRIYGAAAFTDVTSCSRASIGYAPTASGTLTSFSSNELRMTNLGLLVENARTNYIPLSQSFTIADWTPFNLTSVSNNQTVAPDGTTTAGKIVEDTSNSYHGIYNFSSDNAIKTSPVSCSNSIYVKAAGRNFAFLVGKSNSATPIDYSIVVNLTTGAITETHSDNSPSNASGSAETLGNGWFRLNVTLDSIATQTMFLEVGPCASGTGNTWSFGRPTYTGDGSSGIYIWGAQMEIGSFPSSQIPTTSTIATRAADAVTITGAAAAIIDTNTASQFVDFTEIGSTDDLQVVYYGNPVIGKFGGSTATIVIGGPGNLTATVGNSLTFATGFEAASTISASGRTIVGGGGAVASDASVFTVGSPYRFNGTGSPGFITIRRFALWNSKLTDATLQSLTTP